MKRSVKRYFFFTAVVICIFLTALTSASNATENTIIVGSDHDFPPYEFNDQKGNPTGFNIELIKAVCNVMGLKADIRLGVWSEIREKLESGEIDVIAGMFYSAERAKTFAFSKPHNAVSPALFVREDSEIDTFDKARGKEIIVQKNDIMHDYITESNFTDRIITANDPFQALSILARNRHDGVLLSSRIQGLFFAKQFQITGIHAINTPVSPQSYCFAARKDKAEIIDKLNEGIALLKINGNYDKIYAKWFDSYEKKHKTVPIAFLVVFTAILALLGVISWFSWFLRKQVKKKTWELQISERRYRHIVQNASDILAVTDIKGEILYINPVVERILGYSQKEMTGKLYYDYIPENYKEQVKGFFSDQFSSETGFTYYEFPVVKKDNGIIWLGQNSQLLESNSKIEGFQVIARDITDRVCAEAERKKLADRLQRAEKMEALGTLAGGVAHDLNNVLGILVGYSELLLDDIPEDSSLHDHVVQIMNGGIRAAAIVQDLLTMARRGVQVNDIINLNSLITDFLKTPECADLNSRSNNIELITELDPSLLNIRGSGPHLFKALLNLITNAVEAMSTGGTVTVKTANSHLEKPVHGYDNVQKGDYVVLTVADTGEGISEKDIQHIFEPFYTKKVMGRSGTGLGLAVVWGMVKDHNGYVDVSSEKDKGTTFTIYLPVCRDEIKETEFHQSASDLMGSGQTILVIDDMDEQRNLATKMLTRLNYRVISAESGEKALSLLAMGSCDLVILDMIMEPGMDGLDTFKEILKSHPEQRTIIVSGFSSTDRVIQAQALGAGEYVKKPYVLEALGSAVKRELEKKRGN